MYVEKFKPLRNGKPFDPAVTKKPNLINAIKVMIGEPSITES